MMWTLATSIISTRHQRQELGFYGVAQTYNFSKTYRMSEELWTFEYRFADKLPDPTVPSPAEATYHHIQVPCILYLLATKAIRAFFFFIMYGSILLYDCFVLSLYFSDPDANIHTPAALDGAEIAV